MSERPEAISQLKLFSMSTGGAGIMQESWYLLNKSKSFAIRATVKFVDVSTITPKERTESFSLEPGEETRIGLKFENGPFSHADVRATIVGARYL